MKRTTVVLVAMILGIVFLAPALPASSQSDDTTSIELASQTNWVLPGDSFEMTAAVKTSMATENLDLVVTVFGPVKSRSAFTSSLNNQIAGSAVILQRTPLAEALNTSGQISVNLPVNDRSIRATYLANSGIYPVRVELRDSGTDESVAQFVTHLVKFSSTTNLTKVSVATVLSARAETSDDPANPSTTPSNGAEFVDLATSLNSHPDVAASVIPSPESVERLGGSENPLAQQSITTLASSLSSREILPTTWTAIPATLYNGPTQERDIQLDRGLSVIKNKIGVPNESTWAAQEPLNPAAVQTLYGRGVRNLIVRESNLTSLNRSTALLRPFKLKAGNTNVSAVQADQGLTSHFEGDAPPVLRAHQLLADLAVLYNDYPGQVRGAVVMSPPDWTVDPAFTQTYLDGLKTSPILNAVNASSIFTVPFENGLTRSLANVPVDKNLALPTSRLEGERRQLNGLSSMVVDGNPTYIRLEQRLLSAQSSRLDSDERTKALNAFDSDFNDQLKAIRLPPERSIRLTARTGEIPLSIQNDTGYTVKLKVRLTGDQLVFPDGRDRLITVERQQITDRVAIEARTSGAFPVQLELTSPDGSLKLVDSRVTVRSTATSGVGLFLTVGSLAFLVLWWLHSIYKNHRKKVSQPASTTS